MVSALDSALSGLNAATTRIAVSANNIANQDSTKTLKEGQAINTPYVPQRADQVTLSNGGIQVQVKDVNPATTTVADSNPEGTGSKQVPNVDQATQLTDLNIASYDFKANLKVIQVQENLDQALLDIKS